MSVAFMDIEGTPEDCVEVGLVISDSDHKLVAAACFHAPPINEAKFKQDSKFCHGMKLDNLKKKCNEENISSQNELYTQVVDFLKSYNVNMIVGNDGLCTAVGDNAQFLKIAGYTNFHYLNCVLPCWIERDQEWYHTTSVMMKRHHVGVAGKFCRVFHDPVIHVTKGSLRTINAKASSGGHCALYDALEVFLYRDGRLNSQEYFDSLYFLLP